MLPIRPQPVPSNDQATSTQVHVTPLEAQRLALPKPERQRQRPRTLLRRYPAAVSNRRGKSIGGELQVLMGDLPSSVPSQEGTMIEAAADARSRTDHA